MDHRVFGKCTLIIYCEEKANAIGNICFLNYSSSSSSKSSESTLSINSVRSKRRQLKILCSIIVVYIHYKIFIQLFFDYFIFFINGRNILNKLMITIFKKFQVYLDAMVKFSNWGSTSRCCILGPLVVRFQNNITMIQSHQAFHPFYTST
jgi:hypothetical protein